MTSPSTRIKYMTDGMLLRECLIDPLLKKYRVRGGLGGAGLGSGVLGSWGEGCGTGGEGWGDWV
jgi:hypothetical protein